MGVCAVCSERQHSGLNNGMTANYNVPDWSMSRYMRPSETFAPLPPPLAVWHLVRIL